MTPSVAAPGVTHPSVATVAAYVNKPYRISLWYEKIIGGFCMCRLSHVKYHVTGIAFDTRHATLTPSWFDMFLVGLIRSTSHCFLSVISYTHYLLHVCLVSVGFPYRISISMTVASLGLVSPVAATEGVTPIFSGKKLTTFFAHRCHFILLLIPLARVSHPLEGVTRTFFSPIRPCLSTILCKFAHIFLFGCHPWRMSPGAVRPLLVTPLRV